MQFQRISTLVLKEFLLDWKDKNSLAGIFIYVTSTVFVCYLSFQQIVETSIFNALLWIIILFTSINTISKSFMQDNPNRLFYLYSIASPQEIIISKMFYNSALLTVISIITFLCYILLLGNPIQNIIGFFCALIMGSIGLSVLLTLMAAIASKSTKNLTLMAILSFPVILPFFIIIIALTLNLSQGINSPLNVKYYLALGGIIVIGSTMAYLLFPYLWRD